MDEVRVLTPTGALGLGFNRDEFVRCMAEERIDVVAVDAGSTDPGPHYLGAGVPFASRIETRHDTEIILREALKHDVPVLIGSVGGAGSGDNVKWMQELVLELAAENDWSFSLAVIRADVDPGYLTEKLAGGGVKVFESGLQLEPDAIAQSTRIVAQMGPEPIMEALSRGAQVVIAGRACDDSVIAALPLLKGFDPALAIHMGKILECGALAAQPSSNDCMLAIVRRDHFDLVPVSPRLACTPTSIGAHSLYERENPVIQQGPGGTIDLSETSFEQVDPRTIRVRGTTYRSEPEYLVKLEGARPVGYRSICIAGIRDEAMIAQLDPCLKEAESHTRAYFEEAGVSSDSYRVVFHVYGRDAVMQEMEPYRDRLNHEYGLVMEVVAATQEEASAIVRHLRGSLLHLEFPGQFNNSGNLAILYSPSVVPMGQVYEWSVYHLLHLDDPQEIFPIEMVKVGEKAAVPA